MCKCIMTTPLSNWMSNYWQDSGKRVSFVAHNLPGNCKSQNDGSNNGPFPEFISNPLKFTEKLSAVQSKLFRSQKTVHCLAVLLDQVQFVHPMGLDWSKKTFFPQRCCLMVAIIIDGYSQREWLTLSEVKDRTKKAPNCRILKAQLIDSYQDDNLYSLSLSLLFKFINASSPCASNKRNRFFSSLQKLPKRLKIAIWSKLFLQAGQISQPALFAEWHWVPVWREFSAKKIQTKNIL